MRISQLASTYDLDKRSIDYYTNLHLIPCTISEGSKYREYGEDAETVVKKIVILRDAGYSEKKIKEALQDPSYFTTARWNEHIADLHDRINKINTMIKYAEELRDSHSYALKCANELSNPEESHIISQLMKQIAEKLKPIIFSSDEVANKYQDTDGDISEILESWAMCLITLEKLYRKNMSYDSAEVQRAVIKCTKKIKDLYCVFLAYLYDYFKDIDVASVFSLEGEDLEIYTEIMKLIAVIAEWFKIAKSIEGAMDFNRFRECFKEQIKELDQELEDDSFDAMTSIITEICNFPQTASAETLVGILGSKEQLKAGFEMGYEIAAEEDEKKNSEENISIPDDNVDISFDNGMDINFAAFIIDAFKYAINTQRQQIEASFIPTDKLIQNDAG